VVPGDAAGEVSGHKQTLEKIRRPLIPLRENGEKTRNSTWKATSVLKKSTGLSNLQRGKKGTVRASIRSEITSHKKKG